ncbi:unnamed protein product, partial [Allacma fusca]
TYIRKAFVTMSPKRNDPDIHKTHEQYLQTPVGLATISTCDRGIHWIKMAPLSSETETNDTGKSVESKINNSGIIGKQTVEWLEEYFQIKPKSKEILTNPAKYPPICWSGLSKSDFGTQLLKTALEKVKYGKTVSYSELAALAGNPGASRAAGTALKNNPVWIIIPCHRIIKSDGTSELASEDHSWATNWISQPQPTEPTQCPGFRGR